MIESDKDFGTFEFMCDEVGCDTTQVFDTDGDFAEARAEAKLSGWKILKKEGDWFHRCPECV